MIAICLADSVWYILEFYSNYFPQKQDLGHGRWDIVYRPLYNPLNVT